MRPGDAYLLNSPYDGGTHLPDMTVVTPVFDAPGLAHIDFFTASRAHHADVGGITPGSMPPGSRDIGEEGALIAPTRIVRDGRLDEAGCCARCCGRPARAQLPPEPRRPARAARGQCARRARAAARRRRARTRDRCSPTCATCRTTPNAACAARSASCATAASATRWTTARRSRSASPSTARRAARPSTSRARRAQCDNNFNAPRAVTVAAVLYVFRTLIDEPIPLNAGCLRPLDHRRAGAARCSTRVSRRGRRGQRRDVAVHRRRACTARSACRPRHRAR